MEKEIISENETHLVFIEKSRNYHELRLVERATGLCKTMIFDGGSGKLKESIIKGYKDFDIPMFIKEFDYITAYPTYKKNVFKVIDKVNES